MARAWGFLLGLVLCHAACPAWAWAETIVLMPATGDATLLSEALTAHGAVARALEAQGAEALAHAAAVERAGGGELADCRTIECSARLVSALDAQLAVLVSVREVPRTRSSDPGAVVRVALVSADDHRFWGYAAVTLGDVSAAAREALLDARGFQLLGEGPFVRVRSMPSDAEVWIDGERVGETPYRAALRPGRHAFELRKKGYRPHVQMQDLVRDTELPLELDVKLEARAPTPQETARLSDIESAAPHGGENSGGSRPILGPLLLVAAGTAVLVYDIALIASAGCDRTEPTGACTNPSRVNSTLAVALAGVGVAAIGGGVLWFLLGGDDAEAPASVSARVSPVHASITAKF